MVPIARVRSLLNGATTTSLGLDPAARGHHRRIIAPQTAGVDVKRSLRIAAGGAG